MINTILTAIAIYLAVSVLATAAACALFAAASRHDVQAEATHVTMREQRGQL